MRSKWWWLCLAGGMVIGLFYAWMSNEPAGNVRTILMSACSIMAFLLTYFERRGILQVSLLISAGVMVPVLVGHALGRNDSENVAGEVAIVLGLSFVTAMIGAAMARVARNATGSISEDEEQNEKKDEK